MFDLAILIAVITALIELIKRLVIIPVKFLPLCALLLGIVAGIVYLDGNIETQVMYGLMIGLSASGLFDQTKIIKKKEE